MSKSQAAGAFGIPSYDWALKRWLPVSLAQVSADGASYAAFDSSARLVVTDVASGATRAIYSGDARFIWTVVGIRPEGIYVWRAAGEGTVDADRDRLYIVKASGILQLVGDRRSVGGWYLAGGYAWGVETDDPLRLGQPGNEERLLRVDVTTGTSTVWFRRTGTIVGFLGVESDGSALVQSRRELWLVQRPGAERQLAAAGAYFTVSDSRGIWLSNDNGLWLVTPEGEMVVVTMVAVTASNPAPAGICH
jgi:hypothetical protein